jgi:hypothetical protein
LATPAASPPPLYPHSARMQGFLRTDHDSKRKESRKSMRGIKSQAQKTRSLRSLRVAHSKVSFSGRQQWMPCHRPLTAHPRFALRDMQCMSCSRMRSREARGKKKVGCLGQSGCACIALASRTRRAAGLHGPLWAGFHFFFSRARPLVGGSRPPWRGNDVISGQHVLQGPLLPTPPGQPSAR